MGNFISGSHGVEGADAESIVHIKSNQWWFSTSTSVQKMTIDSLSCSYHTMCCVTKLQYQLQSTYFQINEVYSPPMQYQYAL
uniref:Uncharacterized protein n=1 Tax=Aegilops tauschii subsp. strangulata TaxID=200361 RepID=A0A453K8Z7_AEGTS